VNRTVTAKLHVSPLCEVHVTVVLPIGNVEPDGGLQTTESPQLPDVVGVPYATTAVHEVVLTGLAVGQVMVQLVVAAATVVEVDAELLAWCNSFVALVILTPFVMIVPSAVPAAMLKANVKIAVSLASRVAMVQLIVPAALPEAGAVHVKPGPEFCVSDTNVVPAGTEPERTTVCAASGPLLVTSTL
jgi:hypothetical protein